MSKLRRKFIAVLAVLFCALLALSTALLIPTSKAVNAATRSGGWTEIGEIYSGNGGFNAKNMQLLYKAITGNKDATYETVKSTLNTYGTTDGNGYKYLTSQFVRDKNSTNNVSVTFGGIKWDVVFITRATNDVDTDNDGTGDIIVDLWQSADTVTQTSAFADGHASSEVVTDTYPSSMYSTSIIRVKTLNAGGKYTSGGTSENNLVGYDKTSSVSENKYARFTSEDADDSLTKYIVKPTNVAYQQNLSAKDATHATTFYQFPNDAYGYIDANNWTRTPKDLSLIQNKGTGITAYGAWQNDYLWLPAFSETSDFGEGLYGMWKTDSNLRSSVGNAQSTDNASYAWLRSGHRGNSDRAVALSAAGAYGEISTNNTTYLVRPAIHFNLTAAKTLYTEDVTTNYTGSNITLGSIYTAKPTEVPWYISNVYSTNVMDYEYNSDVLNIGTYTVKMSFKSDNTYGYKWDAKSDSSTVKIIVKEKPVKVKFAIQGSGMDFADDSIVTSGKTAEYPKVEWFDTTQIADNDKSTLKCPDLKIRYFSISESKYLEEGEVPAKPGKYRAEAVIEYQDGAVYKNYKLADEADGYKNYVEFTVDPVKVTKPTLSSTELTYNGSAQTVEITGLSTINANDTVVVYTVKKEGGTPGQTKSDSSFEVTDAGKYIITVAFASDEVKATHVWSSSDDYNNKNVNFELELNVAKKQLTVTLERDGTGGWIWQVNTEVKIKVTVSGICQVEGVDEEIVLDVYYTNKDGTRKTDAKSGEEYIIPDLLPRGDNYKLICELSSAEVNANYEIKDAVDGKIEKGFKITAAGVNFNESNLPWVYANGDSTEQKFDEGNKVKYNGKDYIVSLASDADDVLAAMGVKVDGDLKGELSAKNAREAAYVITVRIVALNADYEFDPLDVEFEWYIDKADFDLSSVTLKWQYRARGNVSDYVDGAPYEGGTNALENGLIEVFLSGLPNWLEPVYSTQSIHKKQGYEIGDYIAKIISLTSNDSNYNSVSNLDSYEWATLNWKIVQHVLSTRLNLWEEGDYADGKVTKSPTLGTSYYSVHLVYEYYENDDLSDTPKTDIKDLEYEEGTQKIFYVLAIIDSSYPDDVKNWALDNDSPDSSNPYTFTVGANRTAVEITVTCGGVYDGTPKGVTIELVGTYDEIDLDSFEITYYTASGEVLVGAPTDVGSYSVSIALKEKFADKYYIKSKKTYELVITPRILEVPVYEGSLTYNGEEQDIAKLVGLPDGWENYLEIRINGTASNGKIKDVGVYNFIFEIKNANSGNVAWNSTSNKTSNRTLQLTVNQLVLHAQKWSKNGYYTALEFTEEDGDKFVTYTVKNANGEIVTEAEFYAHPDDEYIIEVSVGEEHGENVRIEYAAGVNPQLKFIGSSTNEGDAADLENRKKAAKEELEKAAQSKREEIDKSDMSDEDKAKAKEQVGAELAKGLDEIDKATNTDDVDKAESAAKIEIENIKIGSKSSFPWWIIAVVVGLLLAAAAVIVVVIKKRQAADGDDYDDYYDDEYDFDEDIEEDYDDGDEDF